MTVQGEPMKAKLTARPFSDPNWVFERKLDGVRASVGRTPQGATLTSRTGRRMTGYPELIRAVHAECAVLGMNDDPVELATWIDADPSRINDLRAC